MRFFKQSFNCLFKLGDHLGLFIMLSVKHIIVRLQLRNFFLEFVLMFASRLFCSAFASRPGDVRLRMGAGSHDLVISIFLFLASSTVLTEWGNAVRLRLRELIPHTNFIMVESSSTIS